MSPLLARLVGEGSGVRRTNERHERGRSRNNRAENSHQPTRRRRGRCKGSRAWDQFKDFSQCMQQHKIPSTSNVILPPQERTEPSGHRPCRHGVKSSLRRERDVPGDLLRALFGNVTEPEKVISFVRQRTKRNVREEMKKQ